ncbi:MAG: ATP-binding protein [Clostridia bacterium]|nr:ATP-binding protein [Clostridia bacterium]
MGYKNEIYAKAMKIKNDAVKMAAAEYEKKLQKLRDERPEFKEAELACAKIGPMVALAALSGEADRFEELKALSEQTTAAYKEMLSEAKITPPECFCPVCEDSGYSNGGWCECVKEIAKSIISEELSHSMPINNCRFDNFDLNYYPDKDDDKGLNPRKRAVGALELSKKFANDFPNVQKSLLFMGETGLGKTHLSLSIVNAVIEKGYSVVYGPAGKLFSAVEKEHFSYNGDTEKLDALLECDLLVIDDLGTEFLSPFTSSLFYNIINSRILENRPCVISTNLSIDDIEKRYTNRIASRFIGNYEPRKLIGSDIRQQKAFENM